MKLRRTSFKTDAAGFVYQNTTVVEENFDGTATVYWGDGGEEQHDGYEKAVDLVEDVFGYHDIEEACSGGPPYDAATATGMYDYDV